MLPDGARTQFGRCIFWKGVVAYTDANGEHQTLSWTPLQGMSIRALSDRKAHKSHTLFIAQSRLFRIVLYLAVEVLPKQAAKNNNGNHQN